MNKLEIAPDRDGYNVEFAAVSSSSDNALKSKHGDEVLENWYAINVQWTIDKDAANYLTQVYRAHEASGFSPFLIDLITNSTEAEESIAHMMPGTFALQSIQGETYIYACQLAVKPRQ